MSKTSSAARQIAAWKVFAAELVGTFVVVVASATGSIVINAKAGGVLGTPFAAAAPAIAVALMVYAFGRVSMAHFNPAVTAGFFVTGHVRARQLPRYFAAEIAGALLASLFAGALVGPKADLGANAPDYTYPGPLIIGI